MYVYLLAYHYDILSNGRNTMLYSWKAYDDTD